MHALLTDSLLAPLRQSAQRTAARAMRHSASACRLDASSKMASCAVLSVTSAASMTSRQLKATAPRRSLESPRMWALRPLLGSAAPPSAGADGAGAAPGTVTGGWAAVLPAPPAVAKGLQSRVAGVNTLSNLLHAKKECCHGEGNVRMALGTCKRCRWCL